MLLLVSLLSVLLALVSAAYLQLPTFILPLGYGWFHAYRAKRWLLRLLALASWVVFMALHPPVWGIVATSVPWLFFLVFSLFNANSRVFIALAETQILKPTRNPYPPEMEILGYVDDAGHAIAYPLQEMVRPRHLLNDIVEGKPLLVSYCMACRSAMVYDPVVRGTRLHFHVAGVHRRNMVIQDAQTGTVWRQGTGEAMYGRLKGHRMPFLPCQLMRLTDWLAEHPQSAIACESGDVPGGLFSKKRLMKMLRITDRLVAPGKTRLDGLPLREPIFGIEVGQHAKAYPVSELRKTRGTFADALGNMRLLVDYDARTHRIRITESDSGTRLVAQSHGWLGWKEFHPQTGIWRA